MLRPKAKDLSAAQGQQEQRGLSFMHDERTHYPKHQHGHSDVVANVPRVPTRKVILQRKVHKP